MTCKQSYSALAALRYGVRQSSGAFFRYSRAVSAIFNFAATRENKGIQADSIQFKPLPPGIWKKWSKATISKT
jgi:hypothetical protein